MIRAYLNGKLRRRQGPKSTRSSLLSTSEIDKLEGKEFCYYTLNRVSRSFAVVIQQLPEKLKDPVCVFYLVLRALDTIEDDEQLDRDYKVSLLNNFHIVSFKDNWSLKNVGDNEDYRNLLEFYPKLAAFFQSLDPEYQKTIVENTKKMADGMIKYTHETVVTEEDFDDYCYYVAGLVGLGLSELFESTGVESHNFSQERELSVSMGLFLQKTNIIRDFQEDYHASRVFWPESIWKNHVNDLEDLVKEPRSENSISCLHHMISSALKHAKDSIRYLSLIENKEVFRFCAIPQVMAIATLNKLISNPKVFTSVVKISKLEAVSIVSKSSNIESVKKQFSYYSRSILKNIKKTDPSYEIISDTLQSLEMNKRESVDLQMNNVKKMI